MNNQKLNYRKILTSERLPESGLFFTNLGELNFNYHHMESYMWSEEYTSDILYPEWWLEEIPNREEELADLLEEAIYHLGEIKWEDWQVETLANFCMNAQNIVWEIKNNAPKLLDDE